MSQLRGWSPELFSLLFSEFINSLWLGNRKYTDLSWVYVCLSGCKICLTFNVRHVWNNWGKNMCELSSNLITYIPVKNICKFTSYNHETKIVSMVFRKMISQMFRDCLVSSLIHYDWEIASILIYRGYTFAYLGARYVWHLMYVMFEITGAKICVS